VLDRVSADETGEPVLGEAGEAVVGARELPVDGAGRVGIVAEVDGEQRALAKRGAAVERPQRRRAL
jgi:hypothetical protein